MFPGVSKGRPLAGATLLNLLERAGFDIEGPMCAPGQPLLDPEGRPLTLAAAAGLTSVTDSDSETMNTTHDKCAGSEFDAEVGALAASTTNEFRSPRGAMPRSRVLGGR